jgi:hypothetical protein
LFSLGIMKKLFMLISLVLFSINTMAQGNFTVVDSATAAAIIKNCEQKFPKFYREFQYIKTHDALIKHFVFIRSAEQGSGPAFANPNGNIRIDVRYLESEVPNFDENRLIVVLYHEIGHLHYFLNTPVADRISENSEKAAFEYSLLKTKEIAETGDCMPLQAGVKFMKLRSKGTNLQDPHVRALKRMVNEPLYAEYVKYLQDKCGK